MTTEHDSDRSGSTRTRRRRSGSRGPSGTGQRQRAAAPPFFAPLALALQPGLVLVLVILFTVALTIGGGGSPAPLAELAVQLTALAALVWAAFQRRADLSMGAVWRRDPLALALAGALVVFMALQCVPLAPTLWGALPGREAVVENAKAFPTMPWQPLSLHPQASFAALLSLLAPFAAYRLASATRAAERDWLLPALAIFAAATLLLEMLQLGGQFFLYETAEPDFVSGFQANRNAQGDILAILLAALACRPFAGSGARARNGFALVQLAGSAVLLLAVVLTGSRAGMALAAAMIALIIGREAWARRHAARRTALAAVAIALAVGAALAALLFRNANVTQALARFDIEGNGRTDIIWPDAWYAAQQFFPWGAGFGSFTRAFRIFESEEFVDLTIPNRAHNEILELLIEGGPLAVALAVAALLLVCWRGWQVWRRGPSAAARSRGALLLLVSVALAAHSMIDYPVRAMSIAVLWALMFGLVTADRGDQAVSGEAAPSRPDTPRRAAPRGRGARIALIASVAAMVVAGFPALVISALDRARRPQPLGLSCLLPTPQSCVAEIAALVSANPKVSFAPLTAGLARANPGDAGIQALHGSQLAVARDPTATIFFFNSARLGWREPLGQITAFQAALAEGDVPKAVLHIDAVMRSRPEAIAQPGLLDGMLSQPAVRQEWAARLAAGPGYYPGLIGTIAAAAGDTAVSDAAWANRLDLLGLVRSNGLATPLRARDLAVWSAYRGNPARAADLLAALSGGGGWTKGELAWSIRPAAGRLPEPGLPFAWATFDGRGGDLAVERPAGEPARFTATRTLGVQAARLARITVFLAPGMHLMQWRVTGAQPQDLFPSVVCPGQGEAALDLLDPPRTDMGLAVVTIPAECKTAMVIVGKGRGTLKRGTTLSDLELDRKRLLE